MEQRFIRVVPFLSQPICDDPELEIPAPVTLWRSAKNICEGTGGCDDSEGVYYTITGGVAWLCPRHWYEMHFGTEAPCRLLEMPAERYRKEAGMQQAAFREGWQRASEQVESAAQMLSDLGLQDEAGQLWQAKGSIGSRIRRL